MLFVPGVTTCSVMVRPLISVQAEDTELTVAITHTEVISVVKVNVSGVNSSNDAEVAFTFHVMPLVKVCSLLSLYVPFTVSSERSRWSVISYSFFVIVPMPSISTVDRLLPPPLTDS